MIDADMNFHHVIYAASGDPLIAETVNHHWRHIRRAMTEECLRDDAPVKSIQRIASQDVEMRSKVLRKDDRIRWFMSSANRDPAVFADPDPFDITRDPNPHVAFGSGVHHGLGATLARLEGQEAFKALAERFPSLQLATEELAYQPSITFRSLESLPVTWNQRGACEPIAARIGDDHRMTQ